MNYPDFVNTKNICLKTNCNDEFKNVLCIILKNPSKANKIACNDTVRNVCNIAYKKLIILNLFLYYSAEAERLIRFIIQSNARGW